MRSDETEAFATRLDAAQAERVREAIEHTDQSRSDLLARAVRYYLEENPDDVPVLRSDDPDPGPLSEIGVLPPVTRSDRTGNEGR